MKKLFLLLLLTCFALPQIGIAGLADRERLAEEYLTINQVHLQVEDVRVRMKESIIGQLDNLPIPPDQLDGLKDQTLAIIEEDLQWDKMKEEYVSLYAEMFTEEELKEIISFSKSPVGRKLNEKMPTLIQKSMSIGQKHSQQAATRVRQAVQDFAAQQRAEQQQKAEEQKAQ